ncbi:hypothetical protein J6590_046720 [Homalodisca vitripennis]|nr:hypothetical protein J6590_046720 [Homalodisca vitripennis]
MLKRSEHDSNSDCALFLSTPRRHSKYVNNSDCALFLYTPRRHSEHVNNSDCALFPSTLRGHPKHVNNSDCDLFLSIPRGRSEQLYRSVNKNVAYYDSLSALHHGREVKIQSRHTYPLTGLDGGCPDDGCLCSMRCGDGTVVTGGTSVFGQVFLCITAPRSRHGMSDVLSAEWTGGPASSYRIAR